MPDDAGRSALGAGSASPGASTRSLSPRLTFWVTAGVFFVLSAAFAFATPLTGVPDEGAHATRAFAVAHGQLTSKFREVQVVPGFTKPITKVRVPRAYAVLDESMLCLLGHIERPAASCAQRIGPDGPTVNGTTYVGTYPPTYYALVGWPSWFLGIRKAMYAMRLVSAAIVALLLAAGARSLTEVAVARGGNAGWASSGVALAATPIVMFVAGGINPNGLEIAAACCLWATGLAVADRLDDAATSPLPTRLLVRLTVAAVLLVASRPLSPVLAAAVLVMIGVAALPWPLQRRPWRDARVASALGIIALAGIGAELAVVLAHSSTAVITSPPAGAEGRGWYLRETTGRTFGYLNQLIGHLGWLDVNISGVVIALWSIAVLGLVGFAFVQGSGRQRLALAGTAAGLLLLPIVAEVVSGPTVGMAWQGRYGLPIAVGLPITAAWILVRRPAASVRPQVVMTAGIAIAGVVAGGQLAALIQLLNRYAVGLPSSVLAVFSASGGLGPFSWRASAWIGVIAGLVVFAGLSWLAWLAWCDSRPWEGSPGVVTMAVGEIPEGAP